MNESNKPQVDVIPPRLHKYRCWTDENHQRMLTHNAVFFASARSFNDPFDCSIPSHPGPLSDDQARGYLTKYLRKNSAEISDHEIELDFERRLKDAVWRNPQHIKNVALLNQEKMYAQGIFTLSASKENILLWSHYADCHRGFSVGFDTVRLLAYFKRLFEDDKLAIHPYPVKYVELYPSFPFFDMPSIDWFFEPLVTKSSTWKYEEEYRFILMDSTSRQFGIDYGIISEVILGCAMPEEHRSEIKEILREKGGKVELFEARMKEKSFGLDIVPADS